MRIWDLDRETLVIRNRRMAEALHQAPYTHRLRDRFLWLLAKAPILPQRSSVSRLLIIRPDHLGDVLLSTPAIHAVKRARPDMEIHVLCGEWSAELLANVDVIDLVLTLDFPGFRRGESRAARNSYLTSLTAARLLRSIGYSGALIMRPDHWWGAMLAFLAGIRQRIGYDTSNVAPFLTDKVPHKHQHAVMQNMRLVERFLGSSDRDGVKLSLSVSLEDKAYIDRYLADWRMDAQKPIICIHPGSGAASKLWQPDKWAKVADVLSAQYSAAIVFTGGSSESALISEIVSEMTDEALAIAGATSVGQLAALYQRALAVLGPDSGAMHIASSVQTPTVTLFGPADPVEFAPWGDQRQHAVVCSSIACRPCRILDWRDDNPAFHPCVQDISASQVLEEARRVINAAATE